MSKEEKPKRHYSGDDDGVHVCVYCAQRKLTVRTRWGHICSRCLNPDWEPEYRYRQCSSLAYEV